ncbi:MAG: FAD-binding oxidoreductase [Anaerolineales bacterium]|nr:FAD-binding oxidoreductase [Anaerolineales bacterium]
MQLNKTWDVIVVGGGLVGSSIAYHLTKTGVRTLLVEQGDLASGASGANFGNVQVQDADFGLSLELTIQGAERCAGLETELDFDLDYRKAGSLLLIENDHQQVLIEERAVHLDAVGLQVELLDQDQLVELEPYLAPDTNIGGLYHPDEGQLNPFKLVHAHALRGRESGLDVRTNTTVTGITTQNGRVKGIDTSSGHLSAGCVVLATGAWTHHLGLTAGVDIPASWVHGEAIITEQLPPSIANAMSSASFFEEAASPDETIVAFAMKQRIEGNIMLGEAITSTNQFNRDVAGSSIVGIAAEGQRRLPRLEQTTIIRSWGIPVAYTADNRPLLGPVDEVENLYIAAGLKSTIVLTPIVGEIMADMITGRAVNPRMKMFSPSRII